MIQHILEYAAIAVLAASGAVVGVRRGFDLFGIAVLAVLTGIGGNLLRDILLGVFPPASLQHWAPITVCFVAALMTTVFARLVIRLSQLVLVLDAIGMGFFATTGAAISVDHGASYFAAALLGMVSAIAGPPPLYGMCTRFAPVRCLSSSPPMCGVPPVPEVP